MKVTLVSFGGWPDSRENEADAPRVTMLQLETGAHRSLSFDDSPGPRVPTRIECSLQRHLHWLPNVHHGRTFRTPGQHHGTPARPRRLSLGPRTDLRFHQALHAGRDLRSPRSHRPSRLAGTRGRTWRPAVAGAVLRRDGEGARLVFSR